MDALFHVTPLTEGEDDGIHLPIIAITKFTGKIPVPSTQLEEIQQEAKKDPQLHILMQYTPMDGQRFARNFHLNFRTTGTTEMNFPWSKVSS